MTMRRFMLSAVLFSCCFSIQAEAIDLTLNGAADFRAFRGVEERGWLDGGLGKTRFGGDNQDGDSGVQFTEANITGSLSLWPAFDLNAHLRSERRQDNPLDVMEAYARFRPQLGAGRPLTVKVGMFFPPISRENFGPGWKSVYTITPSAINSWVGEELRTIGAEARYRFQTGRDRFDIVGAAFGWNDPAGILLGDRGWALHDRWTGLLERTRLPDNFAAGGRPPARIEMFKEIDDRVGWYVGGTWRRPGLPQLTVLRYDNNADPTARRGQVAWATDFWSVEAEMKLPAGFQLLAQWMSGTTIVAPSPASKRTTEFDAAYLLLGYQVDDWTFGARVDVFSTAESTPATRAIRFNDQGNALTGSVSWRFHDHASLAVELLRTDSDRAHRSLLGAARKQTSTQAQTNLRLSF